MLIVTREGDRRCKLRTIQQVRSRPQPVEPVDLRHILRGTQSGSLSASSNDGPVYSSLAGCPATYAGRHSMLLSGYMQHGA